MGSSQSQPSRRSRPTRTGDAPATNAQRPSLPHAQSSTSSLPALASLRRLSTFGRRESSNSKRGRGSSTGSLEGDQKKRRVNDEEDRVNSQAGPSSSSRPAPVNPEAISISSDPPIEQFAQPVGTASDPLIPERLRSLSTIQDVLGPNWPASTSDPFTATDRLRSLRRQSTPSDIQAATPTLNPPARLSDRVCTLLGMPSQPQPQSQIPQLAQPLSANHDDSIDELTSQLEQASADLAEAQRQMDEVRDRLEDTDLTPDAQADAGSGGATAASTEPEPATAALGGGTTRIPAGAVLVIQGLAQTHAMEDAARETAQPPERERRHLFRRRSSSSSERRATESNGSGGGSAGDSSGQGLIDENTASLDTQARMIGGLLTVAAAATATTLLAPASSPITPNSRPTPTGTLSSFLDRFRPQRRDSTSIETALGDYLRNALRDRQRLESGERITGSAAGVTTDGLATDTATTISTEFQAFLQTLQSDLVGAVRAFAGPVEEETTPASTQAADAEPAQSEDPIQTDVDMEQTTVDADSNGNADADQIPSFHYQLGQITVDDEARRYGVTGGTDGQPRRLNFFRAHLFPPVREEENVTPAPTSAADPDGMVPCIFVGVRSITHDPSMTTDELVAHPSFPFVDGQVPPSPSTNSTTGSAQTDDTSSVLSDSSVPTERPATPIPPRSDRPDRRSFRERVLDRLTARRPPRTVGPLNTYLVFVIGGYYPRSHPVLSIPNLVTGGPLTDEEMALVSELMGPGKPPTATKEDIESSGLMVVDSSKIPELNREGKILDSCLDRCLICLGDYEEEQECRILKCRHAYHKECVDQWLSQGRNSCPACRTEAVEVNKKKTAVAPETSTATPTPSQTIDANQITAAAEPAA